MALSNVNEFISEIKAHQAIWDVRSEVYRDDVKEPQAWEKIYVKFVPKFQEMSVSEKREAAFKVKRTWKSLRDNFFKELSQPETKTTVSAASTEKQFILFKQLLFLYPLSEIRQNKEHEGPPQTSFQNIPPEERFGRKRSLSEVQEQESELLENVSQNIKRKIALEEDAAFLLSLLSDFKKIPEDLKLDAKTEFLNVIRKYKPYIYHWPSADYFGNHQQPGYYSQPTHLTVNYQPGYSASQFPTEVHNSNFSQGLQREYNTAQDINTVSSSGLSDAL